MGSTLVITNDFPPRQGGIETFVHALATRMPGDDVVYTSREPGDAAFDATLPFPVVRVAARTLLPTRRAADDAPDRRGGRRRDLPRRGVRQPSIQPRFVAKSSSPARTCRI